MTTSRIDKMVVLLTIGFAMIVQTIITGELGYVRADSLVFLGLGIGFCMMVGSGYALVVPATGLSSVFRAESDAPVAHAAAA